MKQQVMTSNIYSRIIKTCPETGFEFFSFSLLSWMVLVFIEDNLFMLSEIKSLKHNSMNDVRWLFNVSKNSLWKWDLFYKSIHV